MKTYLHSYGYFVIVFYIDYIYLIDRVVNSSLTKTNLNSNDYKILESIFDKSENRGISLGRGTTKKQIIEKTGFSVGKVGATLKALRELELIDYAVKRVQADAFYITEKGINRIKELRTNII